MEKLILKMLVCLFIANMSLKYINTPFQPLIEVKRLYGPPNIGDILLCTGKLIKDLVQNNSYFTTFSTMHTTAYGINCKSVYIQSLFVNRTVRRLYLNARLCVRSLIILMSGLSRVM